MGILIRNARVVTLAQGERPRRGAALGTLAVLPKADVLVEGDKIVGVGPEISTFRPVETQIDARGRVLMPAFIDCHTHAVWAGSRLDEWQRMVGGEPYLEILKAGGGIMSTVRAVRAAGEDELVETLLVRLQVLLREGTTTVEVKSGYGLSTESELKILRAIRRAAQRWAGTVVPTAMIGHALDREHPDFVERTVKETLPAISAEFPGITVDAFCEAAAWSVADTVALLEAAVASGHPVRVHADQFHSLGMLREAVRIGARSVDHLEASSVADLEFLAASKTFGVILPVCGLHTDGRYAKVRKFIDHGGALAIATNSNPGSAPSTSMALPIALASRFCGVTPHEAIAATTVNGAALLGLDDRGTISPGQRADLVLLRHTDERHLAYELGGNPVDVVICAGKVQTRDV
jgi:imidazolonepropionase